MTPLNQRIKLSTACGWWGIRTNIHGELIGGRPNTQNCGEPINIAIPDYDDLNEIHNAEIMCGLHNRDNMQLRVRWVNILRDVVAPRCPTNSAGTPVVSDIDIYQATAAERTEALLRALKLWEEE